MCLLFQPTSICKKNSKDNIFMKLNNITHWGGGGSAKRWRYSIKAYYLVNWVTRGEGGVKKFKKWMMSFMDDFPVLNLYFIKYYYLPTYTFWIVAAR